MIRACLLVTIFCIVSCTSAPSAEEIEAWKDEIHATETAFSQLSQKEGIRNAFLAYAADDAVLLRGDQLVEGKDGIGKYYKEGPRDTTVNLTWSPDYIDVAASGDLGYTYGQYTYSYMDSLGRPAESNGYFHTVWRRQEDGAWKFVWD